MTIPLSRVMGKEVNYQDFAISGTWVHPEPGVLYELYVEMYGGGCGGGGGGARLDTTPSTFKAEGGDGGPAGNLHHVHTFATADVPVIVGTGGAGGAGGTRTAATAGSNNGSAGNDGGDSSFGPFKAMGGKRGVNGGGAGAVLTSTITILNAAPPSGARDGTLMDVSTMGSFYDPGTFFVSSSNSAGGLAYNGGDGSSWFDPAPLGGANVMNNAGQSATASNGETASADHYGAGGGGGGGASVNSIGTTRTVTGGDGGDGVDGRVRVWAWRVG